MACSFSHCNPISTHSVLSVLAAQKVEILQPKERQVPPKLTILCCHHYAVETGNMVNCHLTGGGHEIVDHTNFVSHVCWSIDL